MNTRLKEKYEKLSRNFRMKVLYSSEGDPCIDWKPSITLLVIFDVGRDMLKMR